MMVVLHCDKTKYVLLFYLLWIVWIFTWNLGYHFMNYIYNASWMMLNDHLIMRISWYDNPLMMWSLLGPDRLVQIINFGRRHFQTGEISQGRHHKDYLDKSQIDSTRNPERSFHKILSKFQNSPSIENKFNKYSVYEVQLKRHQFYLIKITPKNRNRKKYLAWAFKLVWAFSNNQDSW